MNDLAEFLIQLMRVVAIGLVLLAAAGLWYALRPRPEPDEHMTVFDRDRPVT